MRVCHISRDFMLVMPHICKDIGHLQDSTVYNCKCRPLNVSTALRQSSMNQAGGYFRASNLYFKSGDGNTAKTMTGLRLPRGYCNNKSSIWRTVRIQSSECSCVGAQQGLSGRSFAE